MQIEKISDNQIRCTLTPDDLKKRHINISELAYGSEKARSLFREMLSEAFREFNFVSDNIPLMIEAMPISGEGLMLVITKVEDPDELDARFSRFSSLVEDDDIDSPFEDIFGSSLRDICADDVLNELEKLCDNYTAGSDDGSDEPSENSLECDFFQVFTFSSVDDVCRAAKALGDAYDAENSLYKDESTSEFYLVVHKDSHSPQTFNKVCNILSEYGEHLHSNAGTAAYYDEHCTVFIRDKALQRLAAL